MLFVILKLQIIVHRLLSDSKEMMNSKLEPTKRKRIKTDEEYSDEHSEHKPLCKYGEKCYQKNSYHLQKFKHPHRDPVVKPELELQVKVFKVTISAI